MARQNPALHNRLLNLFAEEDFRALAPHLEPLDLPKDFKIAAANRPITHFYFPESGIGSIVSSSPIGFKTEVGLVGREGGVPIAAILGSDATAHDILVQVAGHGYRIDLRVFKQILADHARVRELLLRFVQTLSTQTAYTALSNAVHNIEERLARWLLMCHDRTDGNNIALTHDYISVLLAVRRPSVTTALHVLEGNHFIHSTRGLVTIRDREGLEHFAADAYGTPEAEYCRLIGPMRRQ